PMIPIRSGWVMIKRNNDQERRLLTVGRHLGENRIFSFSNVKCDFVVYQFWDHVQRSTCCATIRVLKNGNFQLSVWSFVWLTLCFKMNIPWFQSHRAQNYFHLPSLKSILYVAKSQHNKSNQLQLFKYGGCLGTITTI